MKRHRFEPAALVMGLVLIGLSVSFLLDATGVWDLSDRNATITAASCGLGLVLVTASLTQVVRIVRDVRRRRTPRP
ncbi:hypothetical protein SAMN05216223_107113 [Actinacidiphila yanglinensis]|uniref:Uncharacterized protein n=1 Tax=Actinacidiphila yanglinensis TaxID=310779 RepID=A0A1H6BQ83_9ACTN|nr:hypothetical protein [Actinacidiphila yanglinensis]SEG62854.1 hypothetical protein SAMN05216223_107113 [Actinacidiphila yanglinensis]